MKVTRYMTTKMPLFIRQDEGKAVELGLVSLLDATKQAHRLAKAYLRENLNKRETRVQVFTASATITTIDAWRSGLTINIIHSYSNVRSY